MAVIHNTEKRLITAPLIPGHKVQQWIPGRNPLDAKYWKAAKQHAAVKLWLREGMIKVDMREDMPDPNTPPDAKALADFTTRELERALKDKAIPVQWHPALEAELVKKKEAEVEKRLNPAPPSDVKSLKEIKVDDALPLIEAETDGDVLVAWANADDRKSIEEAIEARLTVLATHDDEDEDEDGDE